MGAMEKRLKKVPLHGFTSSSLTYICIVSQFLRLSHILSKAPKSEQYWLIMDSAGRVPAYVRRYILSLCFAMPGR